MAKSYGLNAAGTEVDVKRSDLPRFWPEDLLPFVDNYRLTASDKTAEMIEERDAQIEAMAEAMIREGQLHPITVRPVGPRFQVIAGDTRHRAMLRINQRKAWPFAERGDPEGTGRIQCTVRSVGDREAFSLSVGENLRRNALDEVSVANAVMTAIERYNYTDAEVRKEFGKENDPAFIPNMRRLASLPDDVKRQIHLGIMRASHGYLLARIPVEEHEAVLHDAAIIEARERGEVEPFPDRIDDAIDEALEFAGEGTRAEFLEGSTEEMSDAERADCLIDMQEREEGIPERTLDTSESQLPPKVVHRAAPQKRAAKTKPSKPSKKTKEKAPSAKSLEKAARARGHLKDVKRQHTIAGMRECVSPWATLPLTPVTSFRVRLAQAIEAWIASADDDAFDAEVKKLEKSRG